MPQRVAKHCKIWSLPRKASAAVASQHQAGTRTTGGSDGRNDLRSGDVDGAAQAMLVWHVFIACSCFSADVHDIFNTSVFLNGLTYIHTYIHTAM